MILTILLQALYVALAFVPPLLIGSLLCGSSPYLNLLLLFAASLAGFVSSAVLGSKKLIAGIPVLALLLYLCFGINGWQLFAFVPAAGLFFALVVSLHHRYGQRGQVMETNVMIAGLVLYAFGYAFSFFAESLSVLCTPLGWLCLLLLVMTLLLVNHQNIIEASGGQARRMLGGNQLLTIGFVGVLVILSCIGSIRDALNAGLRALLGLLLRPSEDGGGGPLPTGGMNMDMDLSQFGEATPAPRWLQILGNVVLYTITTVVLLGLIVLLVYGLSKWLRDIFSSLRKWLQSFQVDNEAEDFQEESEQLLSAKSMAEEFRKDVRRRIKKLFTRPVSWDRLNPQQKVRRLYQNLLREQAPTVRGALSMAPEDFLRAADKEKAGFAPLYNAVRYADYEVSPAQAEQARRDLKSR